MSKYSNNNYPTVNYIGNKDKLTNWIIKNFPIKEGKVLDLFCGGCSVSYALKSNGFTVHSNDVLYSSFVIAKALIENSTVKLNPNSIVFDFNDDELSIIKNITNEFRDNIYYSYEVDELNKLILFSSKLKGYKKYIFLSLLRRSMIRKIPYSRMNVKWSEIKKFRDEDYIYKKYKRRRSYQNATFISHILENINEYNNAVFDNNKDNKAFQNDCFKYLKNTKNNYDVIYLDPPYPGTMNNYYDFYGKFDKVFNKTINYIDLTSSDSFIEKFEELIKLCIKKTKYIVISLNVNKKFDYKELCFMLKKYGNLKIKKHNYQYKTTGKDNKNKSIELLLILEIV